MDYRHDLLQWQLKKLKREGESYTTISKRSGVPKATLWDTINAASKPELETITRTFQALRLNPKYALDFDLKKSQFHLAVL